MHLYIEALLVGIVTCIIGSFISTILMLIFEPEFSFSKYKLFYHRVALGYFITGVSIHLLFEKLGLNKEYCVSGNACKIK